MSHSNQIRVVLFDIGGVLVELSGVPAMLAWMDNRVSRDELLKMWLRSPAVRAFETGQVAPDVFADQLIAEMALPVGRDRLLEEFTRWPVGLFPGALDLVVRIPKKYARATLSNTNALHWTRLTVDLKLGDAFDHHFASHLTGKIKPDEEAFHHVAKTLDCRAEEILFLDDSDVNIEAAKRVGIKAVQTKGIVEAKRILLANGVIAG